MFEYISATHDPIGYMHRTGTSYKTDKVRGMKHFPSNKSMFYVKFHYYVTICYNLLIFKKNHCQSI